MKIGYKNIEVKEMLIMSEYEFKEYVNRENENTENGENMVKGSHRRSGRKNSKVAGFAKKTGAIVFKCNALWRRGSRNLPGSKRVGQQHRR